MSRRGDTIRLREAMTLLELVIAMAMIGIIFAAILPQFAIIRNNWDSKQGSAEALQNGRVLMDHINRNLSKAKQITAVAVSSINFNDCNGVAFQYDVNFVNNYVEYGLTSDRADLAGPVSSLTFTCYDACDVPYTDVNNIRIVKVDATVANVVSPGQNKTFTTWVYLCTNANTELVGWWKLDETSVSTAADSSGSRHEGTLFNMTTPGCWVPGQIGNALTFDGTNDFVQVANLSNCLGTNYTVFWWAKPNTIALKENILLGNNYAAHDFEYYQYSANLRVRADAGIDYDIEVPNVFVVGRWVHICGVGDSNGTRVYVNGVLKGTTSVKKGTTTGYGLHISAYPTGEYSFNGTIDDVCIYNRALSEGEILALCWERGLVQRWQLDETSGTTATNSSGAGNDGILFNMTPPGCWTTGKINGALTFDGTNDYVSVIGLDTYFSYSSTFTATGWFKTSQPTGMQTIVGQWGHYMPVPYVTLPFGWQVLVENNKVVARFAVASTPDDITGTSTVNNGIWHHFALVYPTSSSNAVLYVDGSSQGTPGKKNFVPAFTKFRIGDGSYVSGSGTPVMKGGPFNGTIDDVRIYNRVLSGEEIAALYSGDKPCGVVRIYP